MSKEAYQQFVTKLQKDATWQKELRAKFGDPGKGIAGADLAAFATGKGYKFAVEELKGELTDEQLNSVNGGALFIKFDGLEKTELSPAKIYLKFESFLNKKY